ncbi:hypothetical protein J3A83DRAFT_2611447 [Scleroderma citrinum]
MLRNLYSRGHSTPRSRSGAAVPHQGTDRSFRGNGYGTPRGRGQGFGFDLRSGRGRGQAQYYPRAGFGMPQRGRGRGVQKPPSRDAPLSDLLYFERPLLRPIKFVRATLTPFLFQESEDTFQPVSEFPSTSTKSDAPTAERVARVFNDANNVQPFLLADSASEDEASDELEEIDFADLGKLWAKVDAAATVPKRSKSLKNVVVEETFTGKNNVQKPTSAPESNHVTKAEQIASADGTSTAITSSDVPLLTLEQSIETLKVTQRHGVSAIPVEGRSSLTTAESVEDLGFVIDTEPTEPFPSCSKSNPILFNRAGMGDALGEEDEVIVYVAPHPRMGRVSHSSDTTLRIELPTTSILTGTSETGSSSKKDDEEKHFSVADQGTEPPNEVEPLSLSSVSFNFQRAESSVQPRHPPTLTPSQRKKVQLRAKRKEARVARRRKARRGFGSFGAMMSEAQLHYADERERRDPKWETRRKDDSDIDWGNDDDADSNVIQTKSSGKGKAADDVDKLSSGLDGMDVDPDASMDMSKMLSFVKSMSAEGSRFVTIDDIEDEQRMREEDEEGANEHVTPCSSDVGEDGDEDGDEDEEEEEEAVFRLEEEFMVAESEKETSSGQDGNDEEELEEYDQFFGNQAWDNAIDYLDVLPSAKRKKGKDKASYLPEALQVQWERDRAKKAENKRLRKEARMLAYLDPAAPKKGGKKARKLIKAAFDQLSQTADQRSGVVDMTTIETLLRKFVANIGGGKTIALPPMTQATRKTVHELAAAFNLKSLSKGSGPGRYITLTKTTRSGIINEGKVNAVMKRAIRGSGRVFNGQREGRSRVPAHREGDEVGKESLPTIHGSLLVRALTTPDRKRQSLARATLDSKCCPRWAGRKV